MVLPVTACLQGGDGLQPNCTPNPIVFNAPLVEAKEQGGTNTLAIALGGQQYDTWRRRVTHTGTRVHAKHRLDVVDEAELADDLRTRNMASRN